MFQVASITKSFKEKAVTKGCLFQIKKETKLPCWEIMEQEKALLFNIIAGQLLGRFWGTIHFGLIFKEKLG